MEVVGGHFEIASPGPPILPQPQLDQPALDSGRLILPDFCQQRIDPRIHGLRLPVPRGAPGKQQQGEDGQQCSPSVASATRLWLACHTQQEIAEEVGRSN